MTWFLLKLKLFKISEEYYDSISDMVIINVELKLARDPYTYEFVRESDTQQWRYF